MCIFNPKYQSQLILPPGNAVKLVSSHMGHDLKDTDHFWAKYVIFLRDCPRSVRHFKFSEYRSFFQRLPISCFRQPEEPTKASPCAVSQILADEGRSLGSDTDLGCPRDHQHCVSVSYCQRSYVTCERSFVLPPLVLASERDIVSADTCRTFFFSPSLNAISSMSSILTRSRLSFTAMTSVSS